MEVIVNLRRGSWIAAVGVLSVLVGGAVFFLSHHHAEKKEAPAPQANGIQDFIQKRGEEGLKKRTAMTLAVVYERMLAQYPDNLELKKKLAAAYMEAGQPEKAAQ